MKGDRQFFLLNHAEHRNGHLVLDGIFEDRFDTMDDAILNVNAIPKFIRDGDCFRLNPKLDTAPFRTTIAMRESDGEIFRFVEAIGVKR